MLTISQLIITGILIFSRFSACLMLAPGIGNIRIPIQLRLFLAFSLSLALVLLTETSMHSEFLDVANTEQLLLAVISETMIGLVLGFLNYACFGAIHFMANAIVMSMGYSGESGFELLLESIPESPLVNLINIAAIIIFFTSDMHIVLLHGLLTSYIAIPSDFILQPQASIIDIVNILSQTFLTVLHISAPFLLYAILVNFSIGLLNKMTPSIPIYFVSMPFVITGGLLLLFFLFPEILRFFSREFPNLIGENF